jgi:hypothetical protein
MPISMLVKCEKCGYENFPQHRYCGMCAAELPSPTAATARPGPAPLRVPPPVIRQTETAPPAKKEKVPQQVSGPSFLGLGNEPADTSSVSYLLEEDETTSHRGRNLILILLLAAVAAAAWHWRQDLRMAAARFLSAPARAANAGDSNDQQPNSPAPAASDSTAGATPANSLDAGTSAEKPSTVASPQVDAQTPLAQAQTPSGPPPTAGGTTGAAEATQAAPADQAQAANPPPASDSAATTAVKPDESAEPPSQPPVAPKSAKMAARAATASGLGVAEQEAEGEKYLYGNGVRENCARARSDLLAAAQHSNAQAQSVLGTMYATGHCATRDLPTAYRWFGRSLRQDPSNIRIEQDLKVLWTQMTPDEQKLALRDER